MFAPFGIFRKPEILDRERHRELRLKRPENYSFCEGVDLVPLGYSELLSVSMHYPVIFGSFQGKIFPFAVLGVNGKNPYLREDGTFKIRVIPRAIEVYPFGIIKREEAGSEEWIVIVDEVMEDPSGDPLFEGDEESSFLREIKEALTDLARDFEEALIFSNELAEINLFTLLPEFKVTTKFGEGVFRNILILNVETLKRLSPEKLYYLNASGRMAVIYSVYLSVRNFLFFDLIC